MQYVPTSPLKSIPHSERKRRSFPFITLKPDDIYYEKQLESLSHSSECPSPMSGQLRFSNEMIVELEDPPLTADQQNPPESSQAPAPLNAIESENESIASEKESVDESEIPSVSSEFVPTDHNYYLLQDDFLLMCKDIEYRSQKPRTQSKEEFLRLIAPFFNRTIKSIMKRIDRIRALTPYQKQMLFHYTKRFPEAGIHRKIIFDSKGKKVTVKPLNMKKLPAEEIEFLGKLDSQLKSTDPVPLDYQQFPPSNDCKTIDTDHEKQMKQLIKESFELQIDDEELQKKANKFKESKSHATNTELLKRLSHYFAMNFKGDISRVLRHMQSSSCLNLNELKNKLTLEFLKEKNDLIENELFNKN